MTRVLGVAGVQMSVIPWNFQATFKKMSAYAHQIASGVPWVDLIIFHELAAHGAMQFDTPPADIYAELYSQTVPGAATEQFCNLARHTKRWLVPGTFYEREGDKLFNTAVVISPDGEIVARYRKLFPWYPFEAEFSPGNDFCVFEIPTKGKIGLSICYDMWFPETIRALIWLGAEVIVHPTLTTSGDRELEVVIGRSHAITNQCYFIDINGVGPWGGGYSQIVEPNGRILQRAAGQETVLTEALDLEVVRRTREDGTLGLTQVLKQYRDHPVAYPQYGPDAASGPLFRSLGRLKNYSR